MLTFSIKQINWCKNVYHCHIVLLCPALGLGTLLMGQAVRIGYLIKIYFRSLPSRREWI